MSARHEEQVDMRGVARVAQGPDGAQLVGPGGLKVVAPAKVNLFLDVQERRPDGYHEVVSIMHALTLHDVLHVNRSPEPDAPPVALTCRACEGLPALDVDGDANLASVAVRALAQAVGGEGVVPLRMHLDKHIPAQAGLGGGSADAAAALVAAARLWGLSPDDPRIEEVARGLGADVPFFLRGGCVCLTGSGGVFSHDLEPMGTPVVLVKPEGGVSTGASYRVFDEDPVVLSRADRERALSARAAADVPLRNALARASESVLPELARVRAWLAGQVGPDAVLMAGSGAATFACCGSFAQAGELASQAQARGWWARATTFGPVRAAIVP